MDADASFKKSTPHFLVTIIWQSCAEMLDHKLNQVSKICLSLVWSLECIFWKRTQTFIRFTETTYNLLLTQDSCPAPFLSAVTSSLLTKWRTKLTSWPLALGAANLRKKEKRSSRLCDNNTNAGGGNRGLAVASSNEILSLYAVCFERKDAVSLCSLSC